jgi:Mg2+-importing ATPase
VLCTDKTGTLTVGSLRVRSAIDSQGNPHGLALAYALHCLERDRNGEAHNTIDQALLAAKDAHTNTTDPLQDAQEQAIISFDFSRRRMSTVIEMPDTKRWMITKGATTEVLATCTTYTKDNQSLPLTDTHRADIKKQADTYHDQGYRLLAVARRPIATQTTYTPEDERDMELLGFVLVSDAPKESAASALQSLAALSVRTVILTGDHERVTRHVAEQLGFTITGLHTGDELDSMNDATLRETVEQANVFARITPAQKLRVIEALKHQGHAVAYMGDGVNDAPSLRAADVGISFNTAVDIAKETAGVILLEKNLAVLAEGIREGRRTFVNTRTYLYATISSNFGNMLSVAGAAIFLPFIPLLPAQILLLNLLSAIPMLLISTDTVPDIELAKPKKWNVATISNFMYFFGSISSLADYATFALLLFVAQANVNLFRSAWFIESMLTELVIIFLLRSRKICFAQRPSWPLIISSLVVGIGSIAFVMSPLGRAFGLFPVPLWILGVIVLIVLAYSLLTETGKTAYIRFREKSGNGFT